MTDPSTAPPRVVAVVVTYRPDTATLGRLLDALAPQVVHVVVVDNGSPTESTATLGRAVDAVGGELVALGENAGIAAAQNVGVVRARAAGATHVVLSDQDSLPAPDMIDQLLAGLSRAVAAGHTVGAVGPLTVDDRHPDAPLLFAARRWGPRRADVPADRQALVPVAFLIASGCLVPVEVLTDVGPMRDAWFIDHIDLEWGLRARRAGYELFGVVGARLDHRLGDSMYRLPGRERELHIHSAMRNYYMARNTVLLIRSGLLPWAWRAGYAAWITKYACFYVLAVPPRATRAQRLIAGLVDGALGRTGQSR
jgi:rhamnosyltransferase